MRSLANTWGSDLMSWMETSLVSTLSPMTTGENNPGMAMLARMAVGTPPPPSTTPTLRREGGVVCAFNDMKEVSTRPMMRSKAVFFIVIV